MNSLLSESPLAPSHSLQETVLTNIKKKHPFFHPQFTTDNWVENHGILSLTEAAIALAVAEYRTQIDTHNSNLDIQISQGEKEITTLKQQLMGLSAWNKPRRGEITTALGKLKVEHKATSSDIVKAEIDTKSAALESELTMMTNDREQRNKINSRIDEIVLHGKKLNGERISSEQQTSLAEDLQSALNDVQIKIPEKSTIQISTPSHIPFLSTTRGKVATYLVGISLGTGLACWNIYDQISKGKKPVNAIERLIQGDEKNTKKIMDINTLRNIIQSAMDDVEFRGELPQDVLGDTPTNDKLCGVMIEAVNAKITPEMQQYIGGINVKLHNIQYKYDASGYVSFIGLVFELDTYTGLHFTSIKWIGIRG